MQNVLGLSAGSILSCVDVDECSDGTYLCPDNQQCQNTPGGYQCADPCPPGFAKSLDGTGTCIGELSLFDHPCVTKKMLYNIVQ